MKKILILVFVPIFLFSKHNLKVGINTSLIYEGGETYPVIGINIGYYPFSFFFVFYSLCCCFYSAVHN